MTRALFTQQALIFDLDGTLLDTEPLYTQAAQLVLDPYGHTYSLELKKRVIGGDSRRSAQLTIEEFGLPHTPEEYLKEREGHLARLFPDAAEIAGAGAFLQQERRKGTRLGLATSSDSHLCDLKLGKRGWKDAFAAVVCGNDQDLAASKPAPDIFLLCAARMGVKPEDSVVFEDSLHGIVAAQAAGMKVVALRSPYVDEEALGAADLVIDDFRELVE